jgi:hypothetical protein
MHGPVEASDQIPSVRQRPLVFASVRGDCLSGRGHPVKRDVGEPLASCGHGLRRLACRTAVDQPAVSGLRDPG